VTIEGPRFSTRAESQMFRILGADIINMSIAPEAILSAELGIPYATIAMSTDYDAWRENIAPVSWEEIKEVMKANTQKVQQVFAEIVSLIASHQ
ncbi:MAG: S-methyl-5'-thioadenosine phosphorylase, partial [Mailhella sp.]|nr:S-methyl-5'-thioadenosine phosphorylase [Mailhella sp.]